MRERELSLNQLMHWKNVFSFQSSYVFKRQKSQHLNVWNEHYLALSSENKQQKHELVNWQSVD